MQGRLSNKSPKPVAEPAVLSDIRNLSDDEFLTLGLPNLVYVRKGLAEGREIFAIHAANGQVVGLAEDPESVFSAIAEHSMVVMTVH